MNIRAIRTRLFRPGERLVDFVIECLGSAREGDIVVITSKIVALGQGRVVTVRTPREKESWIRRTSARALRTPWCLLTELNGEWCASAGVDASNADGKLILFPEQVQKEAEKIRNALRRAFRLRQLGVMITDTRLVPMRKGTAGVAVAYAGFEPLKNYVGEKDLFSRELKMTQASVVQPLAAAAVLAMGEGSERKPIARIRGAEVTWTNRRFDPADLTVRPSDDLYQAAYEADARASRRRAKRRSSS